MASEKVLNQKKEEVKKLAEEMKEAKLILLTNYRGITVADDTVLRRDLRNVNATCRIIKNNITKRALEEAGIEGLEDQVVGPTAIIMSNEDYLEPAKTIYKFDKENDFYDIKGGVIEGKVMTKEEIVTLAKLPSRETLLSMLAGALLGNISKVAVALDQVRIQKEENGEKVEEVKVEESAKEAETKAEEPVKEADAKVEEPTAETKVKAEETEKKEEASEEKKDAE